MSQRRLWREISGRSAPTARCRCFRYSVTSALAQPAFSKTCVTKEAHFGAFMSGRGIRGAVNCMGSMYSVEHPAPALSLTPTPITGFLDSYRFRSSNVHFFLLTSCSASSFRYMDLYKNTFGGLLLLNGLVLYRSWHSKSACVPNSPTTSEKAEHRGRENSDGALVQRLKWAFLPVYLLVNGADWLQGPYIYPIYKGMLMFAAIENCIIDPLQMKRASQNHSWHCFSWSASSRAAFQHHLQVPSLIGSAVKQHVSPTAASIRSHA